ncbi:hypothetical protein V6Z92_004504 [Aspergillus fumigatus]
MVEGAGGRGLFRGNQRDLTARDIGLTSLLNGPSDFSFTRYVIPARPLVTGHSTASRIPPRKTTHQLQSADHDATKPHDQIRAGQYASKMIQQRDSVLRKSSRFHTSQHTVGLKLCRCASTVCTSSARRTQNA